MNLWILAFLLTTISSRVLAVPEIARYGHSSCTSCHVATGGGGALTNYGRMFASEKLTTWSIAGEENILHGLVAPSEHLLVGGDSRWAYTRYESGSVKQSKFWRMQTDFEVALHAKDLWIQLVYGTKPAGPYDDLSQHRKIINRGYSARIDLLDDHALIRLGRFLPKFGLMTADHTIYTRTAADIGPESEQSQLELTLQNDQDELSLSVITDQHAPRGEQPPKKGLNLNLARMLGQRSRLSLGALQVENSLQSTSRKLTSVVMSGIVTFTEKLFSLFEVSRVNDLITSSGQKNETDSAALFSTVNYEAFRGFIPFVRYELWNRNLSDPKSALTRYGAGVNWYPRPHFQTEARALVTSSRDRGSRPKLSTDLIFHYYL